MQHTHYKATHCPKDKFAQIMRDAHSVCQRWWLDELDCRVSALRSRIDGASFEDAMRLYEESSLAIPVVVERAGFLDEPHSEIGYHTLDSPLIFLWIICDAGYAEGLGFEKK